MIDLFIVAVFVVYSISNGLRSRKKASRSLEEYFLAGRSVSGWRAGVSMAATQYAADTPLVFVGLIATGGLFLVWRLWIYGIAFLIMGFVFASGWRRARVLTDAELAEIRYSGAGVLGLRCVKALYYGTVINCIALSFVLIAAVRYAEVFLLWHQWLSPEIYQVPLYIIQNWGLSLGGGISGLPTDIADTNNLISIFLIVAFTLMYSTTGGLRSVIATDVAQFGLAMLGSILYAWFVLDHLGGIAALSERLVDIYGAELAAQLSSFSPFHLEALLPFFAVIALQWVFQMNSDGTGYLAQRSMACSSDRQARIAAFTFTWLQILLRSLVWIIVALGLLIIYPFQPEQMLAPSNSFVATRELVFVNGIDDLLPVGARGIMLTGLLAALASTLDTHLNWGASYWSNDLYKAFVCRRMLKREPGNRELVVVARISTLGILTIALVIMSHVDSILEGWKLLLLFGAGMGSVLVLRWLWERMNLFSEIAAMLISLVAGILLLRFYPEDSQEWIRLGLMALVSTAAAIAITWVTPKTDPQVLDSFYRQVKPMGWWRETSKRCGAGDGSAAKKDLIKAVRLTLLCSASLFLMLVGLGRLLIGAEGQSLLLSLTYLALSIGLIPFWWAGVFAKEKS